MLNFKRVEIGQWGKRHICSKTFLVPVGHCKKVCWIAGVCLLDTGCNTAWCYHYCSNLCECCNCGFRVSVTSWHCVHALEMARMCPVRIVLLLALVVVVVSAKKSRDKSGKSSRSSDESDRSSDWSWSAPGDSSDSDFTWENDSSEQIAMESSADTGESNGDSSDLRTSSSISISDSSGSSSSQGSEEPAEETDVGYLPT